MTVKHILSATLLLLSPLLFSQSFQEVPVSIPGVNSGGTCWGDYDSDGDLDLVVNGQLADWSSKTMIYENINGQFSEIAGDFPALFNGLARWGDYDNDDDLDLLVCGMNSLGEGETSLYKNDAGVFTKVETNFTGITLGRVLWLDENRDGWLDVMVAGDSSYNTPAASLYHNNGDGTFSKMDAKLPASVNSSYTFGDYDNDGDDDLFVTGFFEFTYASRLLRNDGNGSFSDTQIPFDSTAYGDMIFLDMDMDMDLDIIYMGNDLIGNYIARVYRNDGNDTFTKISSEIEGEWVGQIDAGDFDNDGDPDLAITGSLCCGDALTELYKNDGAGHFTIYNSGLPARSFSQIRLGDYDNDGDADIILTGIAEMTTGLPMTQLFRNMMGSNQFGINNPPSDPQGLDVDIDLNDVTFQWSPASDDKTPSAALTYNLYLGDMPSAFNHFAPLSNSSNGYNRVYAIGNVNQNTSWLVKDLPAGTYYWSVQALDHSLTGSEFAPEQSFEITYIGVDEIVFGSEWTVYPNPASTFIMIRSESAGTLVISDFRGSSIRTINLAKGESRIDITSLATGMYLINLITEDKTIRTKFIKN
ncbi:MAG: T9SS type A sorting domain-containing protein [Bacteroidales bacterium]|nr:T9SS type A sorting domain-containing protein [Bacteroidales bacterium]